MANKINKLLLKNKKNYQIITFGENLTENEFLNNVGISVKSGAEIIEYRWENKTGKQILSTGKKLRDLMGALGGLLIVFDRIDIAKLINADGIALDNDTIAPNEAYKLSEGKFLLGFHVENNENLSCENEKLIDYLVSDKAINTDIPCFFTTKNK